MAMIVVELFFQSAIIIVNILAHLAYYKAKNIACYNSESIIDCYTISEKFDNEQHS